MMVEVLLFGILVLMTMYKLGSSVAYASLGINGLLLLGVLAYGLPVGLLYTGMIIWFFVLTITGVITR